MDADIDEKSVRIPRDLDLNGDKKFSAGSPEYQSVRRETLGSEQWAEMPLNGDRQKRAHRLFKSEREGCRNDFPHQNIAEQRTKLKPLSRSKEKTNQTFSTLFPPLKA